jgi:ribosomal-protein-alanine N-acetyltransferase
MEERVGLVEISRRHDLVDDEVSYEFLPKVWGTGIAREAVAAVLNHAFEWLGYQRLIAETQAANLPSRRLLEKLGMVHERDVVRFGAPQVIYAMTGPTAGTNGH